MDSAAAEKSPAGSQSMTALLEPALDVAKRFGRGDLAQRVDSARTRVQDPRMRIVVVGPLKQGKSQLVNSLLNLSVCSVGDDETTAIATVVYNADVASAELVLAEPALDPVRVPIPLTDLAGLGPSTPAAGGREVLRVEIGVPSPLLADGLAFVDT